MKDILEPAGDGERAETGTGETALDLVWSRTPATPASLIGNTEKLKVIIPCTSTIFTPETMMRRKRRKTLVLSEALPTPATIKKSGDKLSYIIRQSVHITLRCPKSQEEKTSYLQLTPFYPCYFDFSMYQTITGACALAGLSRSQARKVKPQLEPQRMQKAAALQHPKSQYTCNDHQTLGEVGSFVGNALWGSCWEIFGLMVLQRTS
jgi:hypothetical protein